MYLADARITALHEGEVVLAVEVRKGDVALVSREGVYDARTATEPLDAAIVLLARAALRDGADIVVSADQIEVVSAPRLPRSLGRPETVSLDNAQLRKGLRRLGVDEAAVRSLIALLPEAVRADVEIDYEYGGSFAWSGTSIQALIRGLIATRDLTLEEVRAAWMEASRL